MKAFFSKALLTLTLISVPALADDAMALKTKLDSLESFKASFTQSVTDEQGEVVHQATGNLTMARPDKLRWETESPDETVLIADGNAVWHIDDWVEQVTVMSQAQAIDNNPMVLLTSDNDTIWQQYTITAVNDNTFDVSANAEGGQIRTLSLSFDDKGLATLIMLDSQGQQSAILFNQREFNMPVLPEVFIADVPESFMVDDQRP